MKLEIRQETPQDELVVHALNASAFATDAEARLVDVLRAGGLLTLSLVAVVGGQVVGHIAFSPIVAQAAGVAEAAGRVVPGVGLAPMAVAPSHQRRGIGGQLIARGLQILRAEGHLFCVVLGHPDYYPRHGFIRASLHGLRWEHGHDEAFFVQALPPDGLSGVAGVVRYRPEFDLV